jgi:hypothetical protein
MDQLLSLGDVSGAAKNSEGVSRDQLPEKKGFADQALSRLRGADVWPYTSSTESEACRFYWPDALANVLRIARMNQIAGHVTTQVPA